MLLPFFEMGKTGILTMAVSYRYSNDKVELLCSCTLQRRILTSSLLTQSRILRTKDQSTFFYRIHVETFGYITEYVTMIIILTILVLISVSEAIFHTSSTRILTTTLSHCFTEINLRRPRTSLHYHHCSPRQID